MLGVNQLDFINYCNALKGNYRKGVHKMETLLENPTHAKEFAKNLGGVSVVLGTPVGKEDRNSETLRSMLLASDVANDAVYTWMGQYYEFDSWDELLGDEDRCKAMMANELMWRALSASGVAMGKTVATLAGLSCSAYADMSAVAASSTAMAAVAASSTAMAAVINSSVALNAVVTSSTAMTAIASAASALNAVLKNGTARTKFAGSSYLQSNFDKMLSSVGNTTYFSKKFDYIDSGTKRAVSGGSTDTTATANQSIFLCKKIGAWSNGTQVTGTVTHLQTGNTAGSTSTNKGDGYNTDDYTTGGVQAKFVCIGGCTFAESGDAYCCGIFAYAK